MIQVIDRVVRNIQQAIAELGEQCTNGTLHRAIGIFSRFKSWCLPNLPASGGAVAREAENSALPGMGENDTPLDALFLEDWWLTDNLVYGLGTNGIS